METVTRVEPNNVESKGLLDAEATIAVALERTLQMGGALRFIEATKMYRSQYATFEEYCLDRWGFDLADVESVMRCADIYMYLADVVPGEVQHQEEASRRDLIPWNEYQLRPFVGMDEDQQLQLWIEVVETAPEGDITPKHVKEVLARFDV